jgi:hypothetical protein
MTARDLAQRAARIAAYGSVDIRTPADYTLKEALAAMHREYVVVKKGKKAEQTETVEDGVFGPIFEND